MMKKQIVRSVLQKPSYILYPSDTLHALSAPKILKTLLSTAGRGAKSKGEAELFRSMARHLFQKAPQNFLQILSGDEVRSIARNAVKTIEKSRGLKPWIEIYQPSPARQGWKSEDTVLEITLEDIPFLVQTVEDALNRLGVSINLILHPILAVEKDQKGKIVLIESGIAGVKRRSFLHIRLVSVQGERERKKIKLAISEAIRNLQAVVDDFDRMRAQVHQTISLLKSYENRMMDKRHALREAEDFFEWLLDHHFIFLGFREYRYDRKEQDVFVSMVKGTGLGLLREEIRSTYRKPVSVQTLPADLRKRILGGGLLSFSKTNAVSPIYANQRIDYIGIKKLNEKGQIVGELRILGIFPSDLSTEPVTEIPILREKFERLTRLDEVVLHSHEYKLLLSAYESLPRDFLFTASIPEIRNDLHTFQEMSGKEEAVRVSFRVDKARRGMNVLIVMPKDKFNGRVRRQIQVMLQEQFQAHSIEYHLSFRTDEFANLNFFLPGVQDRPKEFTLPQLRKKVEELTKTWEDRLELVLRRQKNISFTPCPVFTRGYQGMYTPRQALQDLSCLRRAVLKERFLFECPEPEQPEFVSLKLYSPGAEIPLSDIFPILVNFKLKVLDELSFLIECEHRGFLHIFRIQRQRFIDWQDEGLRKRLTEAIEATVETRNGNDRLNGLVLYCGFEYRQVELFRSFHSYLQQIGSVYTRKTINNTLLKEPELVKGLWTFFCARFEPSKKMRDEAQSKAKKDLFRMLKGIKSLQTDRIIRSFYFLIQAMTRTNYFSEKPYISFKLSPEKFEGMPKPVLFREIFVQSPSMMGIHLRNGPVARGGIRWSDRYDDLRVEILDLVKTQTAKNSLIVPTGSKGGFILKYPPSDSKALKEEVLRQYKVLIRGMLELTDSRKGKKIIPPSGIVSHEESDPYMVVAADKGTATFSDFANALSLEYNFWLSDAFASGGAAGYDHKKEGITARGAWECARRHFLEMGKDIEKDSITVIGIGDMSGDVFGNGMLLSKEMLLQAAFNHRHIFLDPKPDAHCAWTERKRLFQTPGSTWADYQEKFISSGGGVFDRSAKAIPLSEKVRVWLGIQEKEISGEALIRKLLQAPVDMLWNGGIGTYVKDEGESHEDVGDPQNNLVRVNAEELRAKIVTEGGNLGLTQKARIAFARAGGRINTDAIDNSAGVDLSDHEVNLKLLFSHDIEQKIKTMALRDRILRENRQTVCRMVVAHNAAQARLLSLEACRAVKEKELFGRLLERLVRTGKLDCKMEFLPSPSEFLERENGNKLLTRPELSKIIAYAKIDFYQEILPDVMKLESFEKFLISYFPEMIQKRFRKEIFHHPLRAEIASTVLTNHLADHFGVVFLSRLREDLGLDLIDAVDLLLRAEEIVQIDSVWEDLASAEKKIRGNRSLHLSMEIERVLYSVCRWLRKNHPPLADIKLYQQGIQKFVSSFISFESSEKAAQMKRIEKSLSMDGLSLPLARKFLSFPYFYTFLDAHHLGRKFRKEPKRCLKILLEVGKSMEMDLIFDALKKIPSSSVWDLPAMAGLRDSFREERKRITGNFLVSKRPIKQSFVQLHKELGPLRREFEKVRKSRPPQLSGFLILLKACQRL